MVLTSVHKRNKLKGWGQALIATFSQRPSISLLAILKNILEPGQWTNRIEDFSHWTNRKQGEPPKKNIRRYLSNKCYFSNMFSSKLRGKWQWQHLTRGAFLEFKNQYRFLFIQRTYHFRPYIWTLSRAPAPSTWGHWDVHVSCIIYVCSKRMQNKV
jgi:hypothetical protein